jgi:hypothetical protein
VPNAKGSFEVRLNPQTAADASVARLSIDKRFEGDLEATSVGEMLAAQGDVTGSAAYVAMEHVTGSLAGRTGAFVLHHVGVMTRGAAELSVRVVPDSGTGQLTGLAGTMTIDVTGGRHLYDFAWTIEG